MLSRSPDILITAYADNIIITGPLSKVGAAIQDLKDTLLSIGLKLNSLESHIHIPSLAASPSSALRAVPGVQRVASTGEEIFEYIISDELSIPIAQQGLRVLGCPIGLDDYCSSQLDSLSRDIEHDLELLQSIRHTYINEQS